MMYLHTIQIIIKSDAKIIQGTPMYCEHTHVLRTHSMYLRTYMYLCTIQILIKSEFIVKRRACFYKHVASVYGIFASRVRRCRGFDYKRGGGYTP